MGLARNSRSRPIALSGGHLPRQRRSQATTKTRSGGNHTVYHRFTMATRSALLRQHDSGNIVGIYCHWNGSPEHQIPILEGKYNSAKLADKLIHLGDLSSLQTDRNWHGLAQDPNPLPYKDRPYESWCSIKPRHFSDLTEARECFRGMDCEYLYLWVPRQGWRIV